MKKALKRLAALALALAALLLVCAPALADDMVGPGPVIPIPTVAKTAVAVTRVEAARETAGSIRVTWTAAPEAAGYMVLRKAPGDKGWRCLGRVAAGGETSFLDTLDSTAPRQYLYRVDVLPADRDRYVGGEGAVAVASNLLVCVDPGHYLGSSGACTDDGKTYRECEFVLDVGLRLRDILEDRYGIQVRMTRENEKIELFGLVNGQSEVEDRGLFSEGCDLFISLHTNAKSNPVRGYAAWYQPLYINKPMVILNTLACSDPLVVDIANRAGLNLAAENYRLGIENKPDYGPAAAGAIPHMGDNPKPGAAPVLVCWRKGNRGDYYGVLRGSNAVGVPGMIIEHAYHTVLAMRKLANDGVLAPLYADIDARAVADGYGFVDVSAYT